MAKKKFEEKYQPNPEIKLFINPYNFIPLGQEPARKRIEEPADKHTGYFVCELKASTPLAIPDANLKEPDEDSKNPDKKAKKHYCYPIYRLDDVPVIPGSSLRGVIRSVYETLTNSCMVTMDPEENITKRSDGKAFTPGVLIKDRGKWVLYKAERIALVGNKKCGYAEIDGNYHPQIIEVEKDEKYLETPEGRLYLGDEVEIEDKGSGHLKKSHKFTGEVWSNHSVSSIKAGPGTGCYLYIGEMIGNKHAESVFRIIDKKNPAVDDQNSILAALSGFKDILEMYRSEAINRNLHANHFGYQGYKRALDKGIIPLWYKIENGYLYFSPAAIGRIAFHTPMRDLSSGHEPCTDRKKLCPACAIFGLIGGSGTKDGEGMGSRVRITDARLVSKVVEDPEKYTLKELGTPRTSYLPFYSIGGKDYDERGAMIRGRKYYWHIPQAANDASVYATDKVNKTDRNGTFELLPVNSTFQFKVYYDGLSGDQVQMLAWALTLGGNQTNNQHKIGHGKPLGLGSVKVTILNSVERNVAEKTGYKTSTVDGHQYDALQKPLIMEEEIWKNLRQITAFYPDSKIKIQYPEVLESESFKTKENVYKDNVLAAHQWFKGYRKERKTLPSIRKAKEEQLPVYELKDYEDDDLQFMKGIIESYDMKEGNWSIIRTDNNEKYCVEPRNIVKGELKKLHKGVPVVFELVKGRVRNCRTVGNESGNGKNNCQKK